MRYGQFDLFCHGSSLPCTHPIPSHPFSFDVGHPIRCRSSYSVLHILFDVGHPMGGTYGGTDGTGRKGMDGRINKQTNSTEDMLHLFEHEREQQLYAVLCFPVKPNTPSSTFAHCADQPCSSCCTSYPSVLPALPTISAAALPLSFSVCCDDINILIFSHGRSSTARTM